MAYDPIVQRLITVGSRKRGIDPVAALAVAAVEGGVRWGGLGDAGTSFGPFQLHVGGALPRGRGASWANSPAGLDYALDQIAKVSRGKKGRAAIEAIVRQFERPAAPGAEIQRALKHYRTGVSETLAPPLSQAVATAAPPTRGARQALLRMLMNTTATILAGGVPDYTGYSVLSQEFPGAKTRLPSQPPARRQAEVEPTGYVGKLALPLPTALGSGSEFSYVDPEGAPDAQGVRRHAGKDWFAPAGTGIRSPVTGKIVEVRASRGTSGQVFGGTVKVRAPSGMVFVFRHVRPGSVRVGQRIQAGDPIASVSPWTGGKTHAHVEVWKNLSSGYRYENMLDPIRVFGR